MTFAPRGGAEPLIGSALPLRPRVWPLAWPTALAFALQASVGLVDFVIVGTLGATPLAAAGVSHQFHFVQLAALAAVNTGATALVARAWGSGRRGEARGVLRTSLGLGCALAAVLMGIIPFADSVIAAFNVGPEVVAAGAPYLQILLAFNLPFAFQLVMATAIRAAGDVRTPLWVGAAMNVVNVVANYGLVFGAFGLPALGLLGSALGTGIAFSAGAALYGVLWWRDLLILPRSAAESTPTPGRLRRLLRIGLPTALEQGAFQLGLWLFLRLVAQYGTEPVSAYLIGVRVLSFSFVPGLGFMTAAATLVGQSLGAGRADLAARAGWRACLGAMAVMGSAGLAIVLWSQSLAGWFGATGAETVALTVRFIAILGAAQPLMAVEFALGGALRGAGDTRFPLLAILTGLFLFRLGGAWIVSGPLGGSVVAVWSCLLADYAVKAALLTWRFASGRWSDLRGDAGDPGCTGDGGSAR